MQAPATPTPAPAPADPVLAFDDVTVEGARRYDSTIWQVSFRLDPGQMLLVLLEREHLRLPLADAAGGLAEPDAGAVRFLGHDWRSLSPDAAAAARGQIGRVFAEQAWVSHMGVDENILLSQRHHTRRPDAEIRDEAARLAQVFSLPGLPRGLPSQVRREDRRRAECVRAFMGEPRLVVLERPVGDDHEIMPPLVSCIRAARKRGAAVVWLTDRADVWNDPGVRPTLLGTMAGSQMRVSAPEAPAPRRPFAPPETSDRGAWESGPQP